MSASNFRRASSAAGFALALAAGTAPAAAQARTEIVYRRVPRAEAGDSTERRVKLLQRQLDSLSRAFYESDELTIAQRRRVADALNATVAQLNELSFRMAGPGDRLLRQAEPVRIQLSPSQMDRGAGDMSRALLQVRELEAARPRGWLGIVAQGAQLELVENGELIVRYFSYPVIVSVDPSSPAQRAGLSPNDTLLAYNGRDVRENDISLTRLLRPAARINVKVLRDGKKLEIPVTVAAVPSRVAQRREVPEAEAFDLAEAPLPPFPRMPQPPTGSIGMVRVRDGVPVASVAPSAPAMPSMQTNSGFGMVNAVLGAQMSTITEGLAQVLGVTSGVLVTSAAMGSPAKESGLRDGDVITKLEGRPITSFSQLRAMLQRASANGEHSVDVDILRNKKTQKLSLSW
ncbi:MAG: PDZ domain-containing protein [Gemmatimonadaceae bacterium]